MTKAFAADQIRLRLVDLMSGVVDPSAGGGVAAQLGSIYSSQVGAAGSLWQKAGAAATAWEQLAQLFAWKSVRDYGAVADGVTDDRTAIQAAITACQAAGGGVVYFPRGTYAIGQNGALGYSFEIAAGVDIQFTGAGYDSILKQTGDAASAAWSLFRFTGACARIRFDSITLDGSGVTNPTTGCHLIQVGTGAAGAMTDIQIFRCKLTGMVVGAGDGIIVTSSAGNTIERIWICDSVVDGCARYGVHIQQACSFIFITDNFITNCTRDIVFDTTANVTIGSVIILDNEVIHTGADKLAVQLSGPATLITRLSMANNLILGGFCEATALQYATINGNILTSGAFASGNAALRLTGSVLDLACVSNIIVRATGASAGPCLSLESAGGLAASRCRVGNNVLINEIASSGFILAIDGTILSIGHNLCRSSDAGGSTVYGIDVQAVGAAVDNLLIHANQITAAAGAFAAGIRLLVNGADIINAGIMNNSGGEIAYGVEFADAGAGTFSGKVMYAANNFDATTGDFLNSGAAAVVPIIGLNGGTFGAQMFSGTGSPEGVVTARAGSIYLNKSGGQATSLYYKESGTGNTGWLAVGGGVLVFGTGDTTTAATAVYPAPGYIAASIATELQLTVTRPGTVRNLNVRVTGAGTDTQNVTYTVRKNGVDTALTVTNVNDAAAPSLTQDLVNSFTVIAGDLLSISIVKTAVVAAGQTNVFATIELV